MKYLNRKTSASAFLFPELKPYKGLAKTFGETAGNISAAKETDSEKSAEKETENKSILIVASDIFRSSSIYRFLDMVIGSMRKIVTGVWAVRNIDDDIRKRLLKLKNEDRLKLIEGEDDSCILGFVRRNIDKLRFTVVTHCVTLQMSLCLISRELKAKNICISDVSDGKIVSPVSAAASVKPVFEPTSDIISGISAEPFRMNGRCPCTGSRVRTDSGSIITLGTPCGVPGGEADVYHVKDDDTRVVKVYRRDTNTLLKYAKIRILMAKAEEFRRLDSELASRMAFPLEIVYNRCGEPVGFTMPYFADMKSLEGVNIKKTFPDATRREVIDLAVSVAELARFAAVNNLYLGDVISSGNILFNDRCEAVMIDLDSAQFTYDGRVYPTNAGKLEYLSPERIGRNEYGFIRTKADDAWSLAIVIFSIITVIHSTPFIGTRKKGSRVNEGLKNDVMNGNYGFRSDSNMAAVIRNIPAFIRMDFYNTFSAKGKNFRGDKRLSAEHWLMSCLRYRSEFRLDRLSDTEKQFIPCE